MYETVSARKLLLWQRAYRRGAGCRRLRGQTAGAGCEGSSCFCLPPLRVLVRLRSPLKCDDVSVRQNFGDCLELSNGYRCRSFDFRCVNCRCRRWCRLRLFLKTAKSWLSTRMNVNEESPTHAGAFEEMLLRVLVRLRSSLHRRWWRQSIGESMGESGSFRLPPLCMLVRMRFLLDLVRGT